MKTTAGMGKIPAVDTALVPVSSPGETLLGMDLTAGLVASIDGQPFAPLLAGPAANAGGELTVSVFADTVIAAASTPVLLAGTTVLTTDPPASDVSMPSMMRLRYDGAPDIIRTVTGSATLGSLAGGLFQLRLTKNAGGAILLAQRQQSVGATPDTQSVSVTTRVSLSSGDFVELWIANLANANNVTAALASIVIGV